MATNGRKRVYCAGPLFNDDEKERMARIAQVLDESGFDVFLPQRDGILFDAAFKDLIDAGRSPDEARRVVRDAIFCLDVYEVVAGCDAMVVNLDGRVPDEGAVAEAAWAWLSGKPLVAYKTDSRSLIHGEDHPLLTGLVESRIASSIDDVVGRLKAMQGNGAVDSEGLLPDHVLAKGREISSRLRENGKPPDYTDLLSLFLDTAA